MGAQTLLMESEQTLPLTLPWISLFRRTILGLLSQMGSEIAYGNLLFPLAR
jgi:hypothetical protein